LTNRYKIFYNKIRRVEVRSWDLRFVAVCGAAGKKFLRRNQEAVSYTYDTPHLFMQDISNSLFGILSAPDGCFAKYPGGLFPPLAAITQARRRLQKAQPEKGQRPGGFAR